MKHSKIILMVALIITAPCIEAGDPNSGLLFADVKVKSPTKMHVEHAVLNEVEYDFDLIGSTPSTYTIANKRVNPCFAKAPVEQWPADRYQQVTYSKPPAGYGSVIGWFAAVNSGTEPGSVFIRAFRLYGVNKNGVRSLVTNKMICPLCDSNNQVWGYDMPRIDWRNAEAWLRPNHGSVFKVANGIIEVPTGTQSKSLFHGWHTVWPRPTARADWSYYVEAEVMVTGGGMFEAGMDFWTAPESVSNTQATVSRWICADPVNPNRWVTVRTPLPVSP
jgi:hypothetical protein